MRVSPYPVMFKVMDEADRILNMDFEVEVDKILKAIPRERRTFLYSATMTKKVTHSLKHHKMLFSFEIVFLFLPGFREIFKEG